MSWVLIVINGIGTAYTNISGQLYPIIGLGGPGIKVRANFDAIPPTERVEPIQPVPVRIKTPPLSPSLPENTDVVGDREVVELDDNGLEIND